MPKNMRITCAKAVDNLWAVLCKAGHLYLYANQASISGMCRSLDFTTNCAHFMYSVIHHNFLFITPVNIVFVHTFHMTNNNQPKLKEGKI
jgi:hypothetical protein